MVREVAEALQADAGGWFVDCTLGLGGHSRAILESSPEARVLGVDRDSRALEMAREELKPFGDRFRCVHANFKDVAAWKGALPEAPAGLLADLGLSGYQLKASRGFSFSDTEALDMRMDPETGLSARDFVNTASEEEIIQVLRTFGEEPMARRIARAIEEVRASAPIEDAASLARIVHGAVPARFRGRVHPATRTFQAIRIFVNQELEGLGAFIEEAAGTLRIGGRIVVLAYHSLEDRIVKQAFAAMAKGCICPPRLPVCACGRTPSLRLVARKALRPSVEETTRNHASRSARLRVGERL